MLWFTRLQGCIFLGSSHAYHQDSHQTLGRSPHASELRGVDIAFALLRHSSGHSGWTVPESPQSDYPSPTLDHIMQGPDHSCLEVLEGSIRNDSNPLGPSTRRVRASDSCPRSARKNEVSSANRGSLRMGVILRLADRILRHELRIARAARLCCHDLQNQRAVTNSNVLGILEYPSSFRPLRTEGEVINLVTTLRFTSSTLDGPT